MQNKPEFSTAIPKRRYRLGDYSLVVLTDVESATQTQYEYIIAVTVDDDPAPGIYLTAEQNPQGGQGNDRYLMRILMHDGSQVVGLSDGYHVLDSFIDDAVAILRKVLNTEKQELYLVS